MGIKSGDSRDKKKDIFISYRRADGYELAKLVKDHLEKAGYSVFLDLEDLRAGKFNEKLYSNIENCNDFIIILTPTSLDRCSNEGDWVRCEIGHAIKHKKNIVPIIRSGFEFPSTPLPDDIRELPDYNGLSWSPEHFESTITHLMRRLNSTPRKKFKKNVIFGIFIIVVIVFGCVYYYYGFTNEIKHDEFAEKEVIQQPSSVASPADIQKENSVLVPSNDNHDELETSQKELEAETKKAIEEKEAAEAAAKKAAEEKKKTEEKLAALKAEQEAARKKQEAELAAIKAQLQKEKAEQTAVPQTPTDDSSAQKENKAALTQNVSPQAAAPETQNRSSSIVREGAVFYVTGPDNGDKYVEKVASQIRENLLPSNQSATSPSGATYSIHWENARIGKTGPNPSTGEYTYFINLTAKVVDIATGQTVALIPDEVTQSGRSSDAARILDSLVQNIGTSMTLKLNSY